MLETKRGSNIAEHLLRCNIYCFMENMGKGKAMECTVSWTGASGTRSAMGFVAETGSGHVVAMDGAPDPAKPDQSGQNLAARPMELVLAGTGGCTAYDVVLILKRASCGSRLQGETDQRARRLRPQGLHPHTHAFHGAWKGHTP